MVSTDFGFDECIERRGTSCYKWDYDSRITGHTGLLAFWVADMDFRTAPAILRRIGKRLEHGIFGYTGRPKSLDDALTGWLERRQGWKARKNEILEMPGIVQSIHMLIRELCEPGDGVVIQEPVYYPFREAVKGGARRLVVNELRRGKDGRWKMDLENLATQIAECGARLLLLCNPHNPVARVWEKEELLRLADICREAEITVISDEIHADLVFQKHQFVPWLSLPKESLPQSITLVSPTKAFNIPGLNIAFAVFSDQKLRRQVHGMLETYGISKGASAPLNYAAAEAAWRESEDWLDSMLAYVKENDDLVRSALVSLLGPDSIAMLEGTYLEWICVAGSLKEEETVWNSLLDAGVWLSRGSQFGMTGTGFLRMNIACPRSRLEIGLDKICNVLRA
ncbi:hypothetical protein JY97_04650 [Alkalispirochaeta odontotermitis]|nr:hypothetical protein JY97_04650 [Alkalispirochaeta odontotermitis]